MGDSTDLIERSVRFINAKVAETVFRGSIEIGRYVLETFFDNDIELAGSKNPYKSKSYRLLCHHEDLSIPHGTLTIMVRVAAQEKWLTDNDIDTMPLNYSHKAELIKLENTDVKLEVAQQCIDESLKVRELADLIRDIRRGMLEAPPDYSTSSVVQYFAKLERFVKNARPPENLADLNHLRDLDQQTQLNVHQQAREYLQNLSALSSELNRIMIYLESIAREKEQPPRPER